MAVKPVPEGYHTYTPYYVVQGAAEFIDFLKRAFGAEETVRMPAPGGKIGHAEVRIGSSMLMLADASLPEHPESVPINALVRVEGTPLAGAAPLEPLDFVRTIAVARITMPKSVVRLSAGREEMSDETQALAFLAGANSIFYGPRLLTTPNPAESHDRALMARLGLVPMAS